jgi:hypothetical protein
MSDSNEQFKEWATQNEPFYQWNDNLSKAWYAAWQHQQSKIDALESQLSIAVDALEQIKESVSEHWSAVYADEALTKINALKDE